MIEIIEEKDLDKYYDKAHFIYSINMMSVFNFMDKESSSYPDRFFSLHSYVLPGDVEDFFKVLKPSIYGGAAFFFDSEDQKRIFDKNEIYKLINI